MGTTSLTITPTRKINLTTPPSTRTYSTATFKDGTIYLSPVVTLERTPLGYSVHPTTFTTMTHSPLPSSAALQQDVTSQSTTLAESVVWYRSPSAGAATWVLGVYSVFSLMIFFFLLTHGTLDWKLNVPRLLPTKVPQKVLLTSLKSIIEIQINTSLGNHGSKDASSSRAMSRLTANTIAASTGEKR
jgi:hypothetical protein